MILNAHPRKEDLSNAIAKSKLKPTYTPCVLLMSGDVPTQLGKIAGLPEGELLKAFRLMIVLLGISDDRRRQEGPLDTVQHWWHRDLNDPHVIREIREECGENADSP